MKFAEMIDISRTHLSNIEAPNVPTSISLELLFKIAEVLDVEIKDGKYQDAYTFDLVMLDDVSNKDESIVHKADEYGVLNQYTVNEYLELYPQDIHKKKLVGIHKVKTVSDIVVGLNKQELEEDLKWVNEELIILNQANKKYIKRS